MNDDSEVPELTPISRYLARLRGGAAITPNGFRTSLRGLSDLDRPGLLFTLITSDERGSVMDREWRKYPDPFLLARFGYLVRHGPGPVDAELFVEESKDLAYAASVWEDLKRFCSTASDDDPYTPTRVVMLDCATERYRNWPTYFELSKVFRMGITDASEFHPSLAVPHVNHHLMGITKAAESSVSLTRLLANSESRRMSVAIDADDESDKFACTAVSGLPPRTTFFRDNPGWDDGRSLFVRVRAPYTSVVESNEIRTRDSERARRLYLDVCDALRSGLEEGIE